MDVVFSGTNNEMFDIFGKERLQIGDRKYRMNINGVNYIFQCEFSDRRETENEDLDEITLSGTLSKEKTQKEVIKDEIGCLKVSIKKLEDSINSLS